MKKALLIAGFCTFNLSACLSSGSDEKNSSSSQNSASSSSVDAASSSSMLDMSSSNLSSSSATSYAVIHSDLPALKRVVGYIPIWRDAQAILDGPNSKILTHVNLSFLNPDDSTMTFTKARADQTWNKIINTLRPRQAAGLKLIASIGGGAAPSWLGHLVKADKREAYADSLINIMEDFKLDGIDIDLEGAIVSDSGNYNAFVKLLADKVHAKNKLVTAAVAGWQKSYYRGDALAKLDFVNLMAYDYTGPWAPKGVGPHSSYARSIADLESFAAKEGVGKDRITLGVPFYAHQFYTEDGVRQGNSESFGNLLGSFPEAVDMDSVGVRGTVGGIYYYNGRPTMRDKTIKAREYGGIMIWELSQDADGDNSLLKVIADHTKP